jgi:phage-related protein
LKVTQATTTEVPTAAADVAPGPQADFYKWDQAMKVSGSDLKILGADFLKLNDSRNFDVFQLKIKGIAEDFVKLSTDMTNNGQTFDKLGADFMKVGNVDNPSPLDLAYKELGGELQTVGKVFSTLSTDFGSLLPAVQVGGNDSDIKLSLGAGFMQLNQDFHKLDSALGGVGEGAAAVIGNLFSHSAGGGGGAG